MIDLNPDIVCRLIELAHEYHAQEQVVIPEEMNNPSGDWGAQILAAHQEDLSELEFKSIIDGLVPVFDFRYSRLLWQPEGSDKRCTLRDYVYNLWQQTHDANATLPPTFVAAGELLP